ncbi:RNI-like protein [Aulographum hederae CBS 113979]|uniref:RNI-like protein n=1 Tax=Aulographum hederae CBS 113979 TaxID=1176131 RepID=A0A6G1H115_9PEZI|nr:RNI-like protein [Aulographum hederae CBS 113979]
MEAPQASIDSIVHSGNVTPTTPHPQSEAIPISPGPKSRSKRLLLGLQRISSSSSLTNRGRSSSTGYRSGGKGSMSCVSLASSSYYYGSSYASEMSAGYSTAPTSASSTPGLDSGFDQRARVKHLNGGEVSTSVGLPSDLRPSSPLGRSSESAELEQDYFSRTIKKERKRRDNFNFWTDMPSEIRIEILRYLGPKEIVQCSSVSKSWHQMCFDGQLWANLDTANFYQDIPGEALINIITSAGPFVRDLNLRGCVQLREKWSTKGLRDACQNLENFSIEGCRIDRTSIHCFLLQNTRLVHINLCGLAGATNNAMKIIGQHCPKVEHLNISWCNNVDTRGLRHVVEGCPSLRELVAGEVRGWDDAEFMVELFTRNSLEKLILMNCDSLSDDSFRALIVGIDPEIDFLTGRPSVPPRKLKHLDVTYCRNITDAGVEFLPHNVPDLEGLQFSHCPSLTDAALLELLPTVPLLTHLDLEEIEALTNVVLQTLAAAPCKSTLEHLGISYCEHLGDSGMLPVLKACTNIASLDMDNTRISDLVLTEAAHLLRTRSAPTRRLRAGEKPEPGMRIVAYDCANVTWMGVREVLSRNAEAQRSPSSSSGTRPTASSSFPPEYIQLKCFYNWQPTVDEHTKRVVRGDFAAAARLERKWAEWMMLTEEAGVGGGRRRRRRARLAAEVHAAEEEEGAEGVGRGGRRRARSGPAAGCSVM